MKTKYCIGFFAAVFLLTSLLGIGYQLSYQYVADKQLAKLETHVEEKKEESITTKGTAEKNDGYYLCALQGYVVVYLGDRETIYEMTEISLDTLPEEVKKEIETGKYVQSENELYGFLENYSS